MRRIDLLVPTGLDDPQQPGGVARYGRELTSALTADGWSVQVAEREPGDRLGPIREGASVLVDGGLLVADPLRMAPDLVPLLHAPPPDRSEVLEALASAPAIVTTSASTRERVQDLLVGGRIPSITVAAPGVGRARPVSTTPSGRHLRCVAPIVPSKGQDVLLGALARIRDLDWRCELVGPSDRDRRFTAALRDRAAALGIADRLVVAGAWRPDPVTRLYEGCDLVVLPSRTEGYGTVIAEAIACGVPVIASDTGGTREAMGGARGARPGLLVRPGDADALADALRLWLSSRGVRLDLTATARDRSRRHRTWAMTAKAVGDALVAAPTGRAGAQEVADLPRRYG